MPSQRETQLQVIRACSGDPISTTELAHRLGRDPSGGATTALVGREPTAKDLVRLPHPTRKDASLYQASPAGLEKLASDAPRVDRDAYLVLIAEPLEPAAVSALAAFVRKHPPAWMLRTHGRFRLVIAYSRRDLADDLERTVATAATTAAAVTVLRVDDQEFPLRL